MKKGRNDISIFKTVMVGCLLCFAFGAKAQRPVVKTSVDKNNILIGQQIDLHIETTMPDNVYRLSWFSVPDTFGNFVPVMQHKIDSSYANGTLKFTQDIILTSFDSGRQVIPPLTFTASPLDSDSAFNFYTDSIPVNVTYAPADSILPFHDIKNIIEVKKEKPWWLWPLIALAAVILALLALFLYKAFKKKKTDTIFESKLTPYDEAMKLLDELAKENLLGEYRAKEYHIRLTDILKRYLSRKTNTYQMHLTADELLIRLKELTVPQEQLSAYAASLRMANAVKFAKFAPPAFESEECLEQTRKIIMEINKIANETRKDGI